VHGRARRIQPRQQLEHLTLKKFETTLGHEKRSGALAPLWDCYFSISIERVTLQELSFSGPNPKISEQCFSRF
jgi:hypothetical protein